MSEYIRSYEGLGRQAFTRSHDGLGLTPFTRTYGGLGALGWTRTPGSTDQISGGVNICFREDEERFASGRGCRPKYGMGCRKPDGRVSRYPCCPGDDTKTVWECPQNWETTTPSAASGTASSAQIRQLQQTMMNAGCPMPRYGADGRWGTETANALQCYAAIVGWDSVSRNYPWAAARAGRPTTGGGGSVATTGGEAAAPPITQAGVFPFAMPGVLGEWWFWVAALGIGGLGIAGYLQYKKNKEEEEFARIGGM